MSELYNILRKKLLQNTNKISFNMHFKRTRCERLSREKFTKLLANFESVVFLYTNKQHWDACLVNECFYAQ